MSANTIQWGKDRPPTGQFDAFSPSPATPGGFGQQQQQPFFPQYGGPTPMTPQGQSRTNLCLGM